MINKQLLNPSSIVVVGGSDDIQKPGGKVLKNLIDGHFKGSLYVVNPKMDEVQGIKSYRERFAGSGLRYPGHRCQILSVDGRDAGETKKYPGIYHSVCRI